MENGQITILNPSPAPSTFKHDEEGLEEEENKEMAVLHIKPMEHRPRLTPYMCYPVLRLL